MITFEADSYDALQRGICDELLNRPEYVGGEKGKVTREILSATICLSDPRARITSSPTRAMNYGPLVGSFVRTITTDGRIAEQRQAVVKELTVNSSSRDAVIDDGALGASQFFIRDNKLHMHTTLRYVDAVWGLTNGMFALTMVQEIILLDLRETRPEIELGDTVFVCGALLLHERHAELAAIIATEDDRVPARMPALLNAGDLDRVAYDEAALREGRAVSGGGYNGAAAWMFDKLLHYRLYRDDVVRWPRKQPTLAS